MGCDYLNHFFLSPPLLELDEGEEIFQSSGTPLPAPILQLEVFLSILCKLLRLYAPAAVSLHGGSAKDRRFFSTNPIPFFPTLSGVEGDLCLGALSDRRATADAVAAMYFGSGTLFLPR